MRLLRVILASLASAALGACHSTDGPQVVALDSTQYDTAFVACLNAARDVGMPALVADRSIGVIETKPRHIGSIMEPWRLDSSGFSQAWESTVQYQRRRIRFEFVPAGFTVPAPTGEGRLAGADLPGSTPDERRFDLLHYKGALELRAWVYVERGFTTGLKPDTYSLSLTSTWTDPITNNPGRERNDVTTRAPTAWTPISRDDAMERTLLTKLEASLHSAPARVPGAPPAAPAPVPAAPPAAPAPTAQ